MSPMAWLFFKNKKQKSYVTCLYKPLTLELSKFNKLLTVEVLIRSEGGKKPEKLISAICLALSTETMHATALLLSTEATHATALVLSTREYCHWFEIPFSIIPFCWIGLKIMVLNLRSIEPQGFGESISGFSGLIHLTCMIRDVTLCFAIMCINTEYICFEFDEKNTFYFSNYQEFDECMYGTRGVQYLQQG